MSSFNENLQWRYATKKFDATRKVPDSDLADLLESLRLSASSYGLQPWTFLVVTDPSVRETLKAAAWNQSQIADASHLIVLCAKRDMDSEYIRAMVAAMEKDRGLPAGELKGYEDMMVQNIGGMTPDGRSQWMQKQIYIALGTLLAACADKRIDATPMEGFDKAKFDEILDLKKDGLQSVVLCPIGYRAADDAYATAKKFRFPITQVVETR